MTHAGPSVWEVCVPYLVPSASWGGLGRGAALPTSFSINPPER